MPKTISGLVELVRLMGSIFIYNLPKLLFRFYVIFVTFLGIFWHGLGVRLVRFDVSWIKKFCSCLSCPGFQRDWTFQGSPDS